MKYCLCEAPTREHDMTRYSPVGFRVSRLAPPNSSLQGIFAREAGLRLLVSREEK